MVEIFRASMPRRLILVIKTITGDEVLIWHVYEVFHHTGFNLAGKTWFFVITVGFIFLRLVDGCHRHVEVLLIAFNY
jgi:hypothetical protein